MTRANALYKPGDRIGRLIILEATTRTIGQKKPRAVIAYTCLCDCGNRISALELNLRKPNHTTSCGCLQRERTSQAKRKPAGHSSYMALYNRCRSAAKYRGIEFELTEPEHRALIVQNCNYCGRRPPAYNCHLNNDGSQNRHRLVRQSLADRSWVNANGIDRIDSLKGYVLGNCVPACMQCNYAKQDYSAEEFVRHCKEVVDYQSKIRGSNAA